jgi:hypothetical protein
MHCHHPLSSTCSVYSVALLIDAVLLLMMLLLVPCNFFVRQGVDEKWREIMRWKDKKLVELGESYD